MLKNVSALSSRAGNWKHDLESEPSLYHVSNQKTQQAFTSAVNIMWNKNKIKLGSQTELKKITDLNKNNNNITDTQVTER